MCAFYRSRKLTCLVTVTLRPRDFSPTCSLDSMSRATNFVHYANRFKKETNKTTSQCVYGCEWVLRKSARMYKCVWRENVWQRFSRNTFSRGKHILSSLLIVHTARRVHTFALHFRSTTKVYYFATFFMEVKTKAGTLDLRVNTYEFRFIFNVVYLR